MCVAVVEQWLLGRCSGTPSIKEETRGYQRSNMESNDGMENGMKQ